MPGLAPGIPAEPQQTIFEHFFATRRHMNRPKQVFEQK
jgi:hypothetical protein